MQHFNFILMCMYSQLCISACSVLNRDYKKAAEPPMKLDWRTKGVVSSVFDQGPVPDVASVTMVEALESMYAIKTGNLTRGSVARVLDCCTPYTPDFDCIYQMGGICRESDYPIQRGTCQPDACIPFATFNKLIVFNGLDDEKLLLLIQTATLIVSIDASSFAFQQYEKDIFQDQTCSSDTVNHLLQLVGYDQTETGEPYWIAKNSWGVNWGDRGYIKILRGKNICGIATQVYQPLLVEMPTTTEIPATATRVTFIYTLTLPLLVFLFLYTNLMHD